MIATFEGAWGYQGDNMNLPVEDVDKSIPFYENMMSFSVVAREDSPHKSAVLGRDGIEMRIAENGGDASQDGCFFKVDNVQAAFDEFKANGLQTEADKAFSIEDYGDTKYKVFFVIAPDGLCYCIGELIPGE